MKKMMRGNYAENFWRRLRINAYFFLVLCATRLPSSLPILCIKCVLHRMQATQIASTAILQRMMRSLGT
ncbi:hypothetical protein A9976_02125 [Delftia sp. UME58]|nr:hypothetical protein [Delftia sp. UME58]